MFVCKSLKSYNRRKLEIVCTVTDTGTEKVNRAPPVHRPCADIKEGLWMNI